MLGMSSILRAVSVAAVLVLSGCAVGNRYDYSSSIHGLPISGTANLQVDVFDERPYVKSGAKKPNFIGLQRGGFGNPFDVTTASGRPLAEDFRAALSSALKERGYSVVGAGDAPARRLELRVREWKSDVMARLQVNYDLELSVFDSAGTLLARNSKNGKSLVGAGFESQNAQAAAQEFELRMTELLRDEGVRKAFDILK